MASECTRVGQTISRNLRAAVVLSAALIGSVALSGSAEAGSAGQWVCIAKSSYGTHATTTNWSSPASSRRQAESSAVGKCVAAAVNKRDCKVQRCWIDG
jgi:hypothetical protein